MKKIYAVKVMEKLEKTSNGFIDIGKTRIVGWYSDGDEAIKHVENNDWNIRDGIYDYALVEECDEGFYPYNSKRWFFKFDEDEEVYWVIQEPDFVKNTVNFTIG